MTHKYPIPLQTALIDYSSESIITIMAAKWQFSASIIPSTFAYRHSFP